MSSKDRKSAGAERKERLAAQLRANLKRRKVKPKATGKFHGKEAEDTDSR